MIYEISVEGGGGGSSQLMYCKFSLCFSRMSVAHAGRRVGLCGLECCRCCFNRVGVKDRTGNGPLEPHCFVMGLRSER